MTLTAGKYALDTNIAIAVLNGDPVISSRWSAVEAAVLPAPVLGELLYGARRSSRRTENEAAIRALASSMELAVCDEAVCSEYARIKDALARTGRPIPENDVWIAACALVSEAILITRDAHFAAIDGLPLDQW